MALVVIDLWKWFYWILICWKFPRCLVKYSVYLKLHHAKLAALSFYHVLATLASRHIFMLHMIKNNVYITNNKLTLESTSFSLLTESFNFIQLKDSFRFVHWVVLILSLIPWLISSLIHSVICSLIPSLIHSSLTLTRVWLIQTANSWSHINIAIILQLILATLLLHYIITPVDGTVEHEDSQNRSRELTQSGWS